MKLRDFDCPNCGGNEMEPTENGHLHCLFCDSRFGEITRICPRCGHYNKEGARHCSLCGTQVVRDCPACGADNWTVANHCVQCGRNLDLIEQMARRWQQTTQQRLHEQRKGMAALKEREELASQARMAPMLEAERLRQEAIAAAEEARRQRDQQAYVLVGVALFVFVILVTLAVLFTSAGS